MVPARAEPKGFDVGKIVPGSDEAESGLEVGKGVAAVYLVLTRIRVRTAVPNSGEVVAKSKPASGC
jgi:hypothetical protein